jgi:hypothetical protein
MAEDLVIDVHFKAYHFEKTAEKGETTERNTNAAKSIVRLVLKGRQQKFGIKNLICSNYFQMLQKSLINSNTIPRQLV